MQLSFINCIYVGELEVLANYLKVIIILYSYHSKLSEFFNTLFLSYFFVKKYLLVGASSMLWAVQ